jgi:hypothetical protein
MDMDARAAASRSAAVRATGGLDMTAACWTALSFAATARAVCGAAAAAAFLVVRTALGAMEAEV